MEQSDVIEFARLLPEVCHVKDRIVAFFAMLELARLKFIEIVEALSKLWPIHLRQVRSLRELNVALLDQF